MEWSGLETLVMNLQSRTKGLLNETLEGPRPSMRRKHDTVTRNITL